MKTSHSPAARRLMALAQPSAPVQHFADGGPVGFGARGLAGLRDLIPKIQAMGYHQAAPAPAAPAPASDPRAAQLQAMIPQMEAMGYKQQRMANGGHVRGPGTGTSDSIPAKLSDGEFVLPADTVRKVGVRRLQDLVDMTHTPTGKKTHPGHFADGGIAGRPRRPDTSAAEFAGTMSQQRAVADSQTQEDIAQMAQETARAEAAARAASESRPVQETSSLESRVAQIPTGGMKAPAADGSQDSWANTETGRNLSNIATALPGAMGGAIPAIAKTGGAISGGIDAATRLLNAGAGAAAIGAIPGAAAAQGATASSGGAGRGGVNPPVVDPSAPAPVASPSTASTTAPSTTSPATTSDVTRVGNSYSGSNVAGDITVNGRAPGGGFVAMDGAASQGNGARERLMAAGTGQTPSVQAPTVLHSDNSWQARNNLRNLEVSASSIMNRPEWNRAGIRDAEGKVAAFNAAQANDASLRAAQPGIDQAAMRENAGLQREGMQQAGETQRADIRAQGVADANQIARGRLSLEQIAAGYSNRSADRIDRAQAALENATTPEGQKSARARLMALAGKTDDDQWAYSPGGQTVDPKTGLAVTQPGVIFNKRTGETRADGGQQATQRVSSQAQFDALPKGATYTGADGRTYRKP